MAEKLFPPKMAMMKISASFPHGMDALNGEGDDIRTSLE